MKTTATCRVCGREFETVEMVKVDDPNTKYHYQCVECFERMEDYSCESTKEVGVSKKVPVTIGCEHEFCGLTDEQLHAVRRLQRYEYVPSHDCTVQIEYKSPVIHNLNNVPKLLRSIYEENGIKNDYRASTHVNVWCDGLDSNDYDLIREYYDVLFKPFYDAVVSHYDNHQALFGRHMNDWCDGFHNNVHECLINTESAKRWNPRLELRICKYQKCEQYMLCLKFATEMMKCIITNFLKYKNTNKLDHKASVTAGKIESLYQKYVKKALEVSTRAERLEWD